MKKTAEVSIFLLFGLLTTVASISRSRQSVKGPTKIEAGTEIRL
jgi:hypothetical protein